MENQFKQTAALIGDPTRAAVMWTLLEGKAFTATELAIAADTTPQNMSMHLSKLVKADLLRVENQGRHRYYAFSRKEIAYAIEAMANLIPYPRNTAKTATVNDSPVKFCRTCYDHLAGRIGVAVTDSLLRQGIIVGKDTITGVSKKGEKWFGELGIDIASLKGQRRSFLRPCLDWSERRYHIAGSLAAALLEAMLANDWIRRIKNSRAIIFTGAGQKEFYKKFLITVK